MVKNLKLLREEHGISQQKLADMLEITQQAVYKYEKTSVEPDIATLIKISQIFSVSVDYLIGNSEARERNIDHGTVFLTPDEHEHIKTWRKLPENIQQKLQALLSDIANHR